MILALLYWLHMLATVFWLGGLGLMGVVVLPAAEKHLPAKPRATFLLALSRSMERIGWGALTVLLATGMFQMSANPYYNGFLAIENAWARAILFKHIVFLLMGTVSVAQTWFVLPALQRQVWRLAHGKANTQEMAALERRHRGLLRLNLALALLILLLTALARAA
jgi:uncharacterized membrane protein